MPRRECDNLFNPAYFDLKDSVSLYMKKHWGLAIALAAAALLYAWPTQAYYCGFDDIRELHRIKYIPQPGLASDFSTPLVGGGGHKYRPLTWTVNRLTWDRGQGSPLAFRARNLLFHLWNIAMLYGIAWLLFSDATIALLVALLFALHPLAHQSIIGATWTVTVSIAGLLTGLFLFFWSLRDGKSSVPWAAASLVSGAIGLFCYDAMAPYYGMVVCFLALRWWEAGRRPVSIPYLVVFVLGVVAGPLAYAILRRQATPPSGLSNMIPPAVEIVKNTVMYLGAPWMFIDPVLSHGWLGLPLPGAAIRQGQDRLLWFAFNSLPVLAVLALMVWNAQAIRSRLGRVNWPRAAFLVICLAGAQSPFILFAGHASETYLYLFVALYLLIAVYLLARLATPRTTWIAAGLVLCLYVPAVLERSQRVSQCGEIVRNILAGMRSASGAQELLLAPVSGEPVTEMYGFYGYRGIDAIGIGEYGREAIPEAFHYVTGSTGKVTVVPEWTLRQSCRQAQPGQRCFWVHADGVFRPHPAP